MRNLLIIILVLGLTACASHTTERRQDVYTGQTMDTTPTIALPADLNKSDVQDYYRIPDVVHEKNNQNAQVSDKPPQI